MYQNNKKLSFTINTLLLSFSLNNIGFADGFKTEGLGDGNDPCGPNSGVNCGIGLDDVDFQALGKSAKNYKEGGTGYALGCAMLMAAGSDACGEFMTDEAVDKAAGNKPKDNDDGSGTDEDQDRDNNNAKDTDVDSDIDTDTETDSSAVASSATSEKKRKQKKLKMRKKKNQRAAFKAKRQQRLK